MRRGIATCHDMGNVVYTTLFETALAEAEAEAGEIEAALASIDRTVALTERTGQRWNEADTHRARGEILFKRDPANTAPAEKAFLTAIAVAQQQKARSFELRAALSLAKLYQSTGRAADAHAVLAPALEGFSPTPEFPGDRPKRRRCSPRSRTTDRGEESRRLSPAPAETTDQLRPSDDMVQRFWLRRKQKPPSSAPRNSLLGSTTPAEQFTDPVWAVGRLPVARRVCGGSGDCRGLPA